MSCSITAPCSNSTITTTTTNTMNQIFSSDTVKITLSTKPTLIPYIDGLVLIVIGICGIIFIRQRAKNRQKSQKQIEQEIEPFEN